MEGKLSAWNLPFVNYMVEAHLMAYIMSNKMDSQIFNNHAPIHSHIVDRSSHFHITLYVYILVFYLIVLTLVFTKVGPYYTCNTFLSYSLKRDTYITRC